MNVNIVIDRKKKLQKLNTYYKQTLITVMATKSLENQNLSDFYC